MIFRESAQRRQIIENLTSRHDHPTAAIVYQSLKKKNPHLSLGTVYRNLDILEQQGRILRLTFDPGEMHYDAHIEPHAHFVCRKCRQIWDLAMPEQPEPISRPSSLKEFVVEKMHLDLIGLCKPCQDQVPTKGGN